MSAPPERTSRKILAARAGRRRPAGISAGIFALALVFSLAYVFFLRMPPQEPTPMVESIQGTYVFQNESDGRSRSENGGFSALANGDAGGRMQVTLPAADRPQGVERPSAYDAGRRTELTLTGAPPRGRSYSRTVGAWPPVWQVATRSPLDYQGLAANVRSAIEDGDRTIGIKPLKDGGRKVWRAAISFGGTAVDVAVDQQTGIVLWYSRSAGGRNETFSADVDWDAKPRPADEFAIDLPASAEVTTSRDGDYVYQPTLAAAGAAVGFVPLGSTLQPDGYALRAVAVGRPYQAPLAWLAGATPFPPGLPSPAAYNEVAQLFTRGLTWFSLQQVAASGTPRFAALSRRAADLYATRGCRHAAKRCNTAPSPAPRRARGTTGPARPSSWPTTTTPWWHVVASPGRNSSRWPRD